MEQGGDNLAPLELILGDRIQKFRRRAGLTQQALCQKANLSYSTLAKIERGAIKSPSIFTVLSLAKALDVSLDNLVGLNSLVNSSRSLKTSRSGVKFVYFDVNGCIVRFYQRAFGKIADEFGMPADLIESAFWHYNDEACKGVLSLAEFNKEFAKKLNVPSIEWQKYYLEAAEPIPEMLELLSWTAENYKFGLLTNIMPGLLGELMKRGSVPSLAYDSIIDSSELGVVKPDKKIYEIATKKAGCLPEEILLIDDTRGNLMVAESFGWHVIWFDYARPDESVAHIRDALKS